MSSHNKFDDDDSDLDQLARDLDLDMDAPLGSTFAAALRDTGSGASKFDDADFSMDDDGFMTPPPRATQAAQPVFATEELQAHSDFDMETDLEGEMEAGSYDEEFGDDIEAFDPPPPPMPQAAPSSEQASAWLQPKPAAPADDMPPLTAMDAEPVAEEDAAGQGLGYDYSFGAQHSGGDRPR